MKNNRNFFIETKKNFSSKHVLIAFFATLVLLLFYRVGASVAMPGVVIEKHSSDGDNSIFDVLNLLGGGGANQLSFLAIGISPYITAQIIIQLLTSDLIKPLTNLNKSGERGKRKIEMITRILTIPFAFAQAFAILSLALSTKRIQIEVNNTPVSDISNIPGKDIFKYIFAMTAGTMVSLFISDIISKRGIGNGVTLIILSGILSNLYFNFIQVYKNFIPDNSQTGEHLILSIFYFLSYTIFFILLLAAAVFINSSIRKIPIQQTGSSLTKDTSEMAYLPIKINPSGVIPVIFASSLLSIPVTIATFINPTSQNEINKVIGLTSPFGLAIYFILILLFSFFYSFVQINPEDINKQFLKSGRFIPGIKAGPQTEKYISRILLRINFIGAPALAIIASTPYLISIIAKIPTGISIGGTGIIIIASASSDFWQSMCSLQSSSSYVMKRKKIEEYSIRNEEVKGKYLW
ncbi:MAG: preprotein translocase subunit SecY [Mycoplasmoidaceae bacterium]